MARMTLRGFPEAPAGAHWCAACAVLAKGTLLVPLAEHIQLGLADESKEEFFVEVDHRKVLELLELAVSWGVSPLVSGVLPVPLCWGHLPAIDGNAPPPEQPEQPQHPGLLRPGQPEPRRRWP